MVEVMRRDFNEHHMTQVHMTESQLGEMQMMEKVGMNYPDTPDSRYEAQPVEDFQFPLEEEMGSAENPMTTDEDECFSETMTRQNTPRQQPPAM